EAEAENVLRSAGVAPRDIQYARSVDMRYRGQRKELTIGVPPGRLVGNGAKALRKAFEEGYERVYHRTHLGHAVEALAWRLAAIGPAIQDPGKAMRPGSKVTPPKCERKRPMLFAEIGASRVCSVFSRYDLTPGMTVRGPAVIEEAESTTVIGPGGSATLDR